MKIDTTEVEQAIHNTLPDIPKDAIVVAAHVYGYLKYSNLSYNLKYEDIIKWMAHMRQERFSVLEGKANLSPNEMIENATVAVLLPLYRGDEYEAVFEVVSRIQKRDHVMEDICERQRKKNQH